MQNTHNILNINDGSPVENTQLPDLVTFSHLRWDFVFQRPQHLLSRCAKTQRVFFIEEPFYDNIESGYIVQKYHSETGVTVVTPHLPSTHSNERNVKDQASLIKGIFKRNNIKEFISWYYTPMALPFTKSFKPVIRIFDCMDELSAFAGAPADLLELEAELLKQSDIVFTGGRSLYEAKKDRHHNVHCFPSSIDKHHFEKARSITTEPDDQKHINSQKIGFFGVIDERMDIELLEAVAKLRPDWNLIIIGPVVKIDPSILPQNKNIHYLGQKNYEELPGYLSGWDAAMMPFARNESTKYISPTKIPEYLAAGVPVISTSIRDVVNPYGKLGLVQIADEAEDFIRSAEKALMQKSDPTWRNEVSSYLSNTSWDSTWGQMKDLICEVLESKRAIKHQPNIAQDVLSA